jgi:hypothetical protein
MPFRVSSIAGAGETACVAANGVAGGLDSLDLLEQQLQPIEFATDLCLQMCRQHTAVAGLAFLQSHASIARLTQLYDRLRGMTVPCGFRDLSICRQLFRPRQSKRDK